MSQSVQEVLNAITEASAALNREPQLRNQITTLTYQLENALKHSQELEIHITEYKSVIDDLQSKVRSLEVERDEMGFRELEAQDKLDMLRGMVTNFTCSVEAVMPKAVEINETKPVTMEEMKEAAHVAVPDPFAGVASAASGSSSQGLSDNPFPSSVSTTITQSESVPSPIANGTENATSSDQSESPLLSAPTTESQSTSAPSAVEGTGIALSNKPYTGLTYTQAIGKTDATYITLEVWLHNGGTEEDYWK